jgi:hypothetical protein
MAEPNELECLPCSGTGKIRMVFDIVPGRMPDDPEPLEIDCPRCRGTGLVPIKAKLTPSRPASTRPPQPPYPARLPWPLPKPV